MSRVKVLGPTEGGVSGVPITTFLTGREESDFRTRWVEQESPSAFFGADRAGLTERGLRGAPAIRIHQNGVPRLSFPAWSVW